MKLFFALAIFVTAITARADFVIQQKIESADQNGVLTLKIKGDKTRLDMPTERLGNVSVIQDLNTGDKIMMIHQQKVAKMQSAAEQASAGNDGENPALVKTGKTEKVGNYDTEIYTWTNDHGMSGTLWVAVNYPDYPKFKSLLKKLHDSKAGQMLKGTQPDTSTLPGMVVKSKKETPLGEVATTLISAKEEPVNASDFQIPDDYRIVGLPITTNPTPAQNK